MDRGLAAARPRESRLVSDAIARAQGGDAEALHFLYVRYAADVHGYVKSLVRDHHEAEDITQTVFAKLMTAIRGYERREVPFAAWILRVARNAALDHLRVRRAIPVAEVRATGAGYEPATAARAAGLRQALDRLPDDQREVLILRHVAGLSPGEIARVLGRSESSVHGLHHRGRRCLQEALTELGVAPVVASA